MSSMRHLLLLTLMTVARLQDLMTSTRFTLLPCGLRVRSYDTLRVQVEPGDLVYANWRDMDRWFYGRITAVRTYCNIHSLYCDIYTQHHNRFMHVPHGCTILNTVMATSSSGWLAIELSSCRGRLPLLPKRKSRPLATLVRIVLCLI